jgi:hypothetical protein
MSGRDLVVQNVVSWRSIRGFGGQWQATQIGLVTRADSPLLKRAHPEDEYNHVSHETIYRSPFVQARGVHKKELHLRSKRSMRRSGPVDPNGDRRGYMKDATAIRQRRSVEDRASDLDCNELVSQIS